MRDPPEAPKHVTTTDDGVDVERSPRPESAPGSDVTVRACGLVKRYGELVAIDGIDFEVRAGTCPRGGCPCRKL